MLLLTTPGRRTGLPRSTCVRCLSLDEASVVWGTGSGAPRDPDWFENLRAVEARGELADVQLGSRALRARPRELHGEERDRVWRSVVLARAPEVQRFARKARRVIPVAVLDPMQDRPGRD